VLGVEQVCTAVFISQNVMEYSFLPGRNGLATGLLANKFLFTQLACILGPTGLGPNNKVSLTVTTKGRSAQ